MHSINDIDILIVFNDYLVIRNTVAVDGCVCRHALERQHRRMKKAPTPEGVRVVATWLDACPRDPFQSR